MPGRVIAVVVVALVGCGRIGYDRVDDDVGLDATDAVPTDATGLACNTPVRVHELPVPTGKNVIAIDVAATTTGFVAVWSIEGAVYSAGLDVDAAYAITVNQSGSLVADYGTPDLAIESNGDRAVLAIDNVSADAIWFYPLDQSGYGRGATKSADGVHAHGNGYLVADPSELVFGVAATNGTDTVTLEREIDSHPWVAPKPTLTGILADNTGISRLRDGYAVISGRGAQCDLTAVDDNVDPTGAIQTMDMTCHNATVVQSATSEHVVAAWNCEDDMVWLTGGSLDSALPAYHALYGDAEHSASNPRLAPTTAGIWYAFAVAGGRLGRALVDDNGEARPSVTPDLIVGSGAGPFDLVSRADQAFLFWTEPAAANGLWAMRLCE